MILKVSHGGGLTSCLTVILHDACQHQGRTGDWPESVDASGSFRTCKDTPSQNLSEILIAPPRHHHGRPVIFDHGHQYAAYRDLDLRALNGLAKSYCWPSSTVGDTAYNLRKIIGRRTCVIYRGNDKAKEMARVPYDSMFEAAEMAGGPYVVQTDELEFYEAFADRFWKDGGTIAMPGASMIRRDPNKVVTGGSRFAVRFLASLFACSQAPRLITTTGNTGLWPAIWRGNARGLWQVHPEHGILAPLNHGIPEEYRA